MPGTLILGAQWGDEGKGKITDMLASQANAVARYQGGDNAGHTVVVGQETFKLHLIPSGILYPKVTCFLGNGVVVNPARLLEEIAQLKARGVDVSPVRLKISDRAHLVMPYHPVLDKASEASLGRSAIGTTGRGIGPAYVDKAARQGIRVHQMLRDDFASRVREAVEAKNKVLQELYGLPPLDAGQIADQYAGYAAQLRPYIADVSRALDELYRCGRNILYEGAQGTLLDLDHGTYPYVTSSSPTVGGVFTGLGIGPQHLDHIIAAAKAYQTRVGAGPFPTELLDAVGDRMVEQGQEYGTTTGRRRRTGWLDMVTLRYSARLNGIQQIALTKLDVLSGLNTLKVCVAYRRRGERLEDFPADLEALGECEPIYVECKGWEEEIGQAKEMSDLPPEAQDYIKLIEDHLELPITVISVGPDREQTIHRKERS